MSVEHSVTGGHCAAGSTAQTAWSSSIATRPPLHKGLGSFGLESAHVSPTKSYWRVVRDDEHENDAIFTNGT
jgi:hypothetical protein